MNLLRTLIILFFLSLLSSCSLFDNNNPPTLRGEDIPVDKLEFLVQKSSASSDWIYCESIELDLSRYDQIDSIIFVPNLRSQTVVKKCIAELFDYTNDKPVNNSLVQSFVSYTLHHVRSDNLIDSFGKEPSDIGIRFRSSEDGHHVEVGVGSHLLIFYQ